MTVLAQPMRAYKVAVLRSAPWTPWRRLQPAWEQEYEYNKVLVTLELPAESMAFIHSTGCLRASEARVLDIRKFSDDSSTQHAWSLFSWIVKHEPFVYSIGATVTPANFSPFHRIEGGGIHAFSDRDMARTFQFH